MLNILLKINRQKKFDNWHAVFKLITREIAKMSGIFLGEGDFVQNGPDTSTYFALSCLFPKALHIIYQYACTKFEVSALNQVYLKVVL